MSELDRIERVLGQLGEAAFFLQLFGGPELAAQLIRDPWPVRQERVLAKWAGMSEVYRLHVVRLVKMPAGLDNMLDPVPAVMTERTRTRLATAIDEALQRAADRVGNTDVATLRANHRRALAQAAGGAS